MRHLLVVCLMVVGGCFVTDHFATDQDTRFYTGLCRCTTCLDPGWA